MEQDLARSYSSYDEHGRIAPIKWQLQPSIVCMLTETQGHRYVEGHHDPDESHIQEGAVVARPANPARLDGTILRDLPRPCTIIIDGTRYDCQDDTAELDFAYPKTYQVRVEAFPFRDASFEVFA
ncbi:hypothetical protein [Cupriavidus malaysiensis]|uniref:Uncharacterized protein n=1 Tax=Cupriavidus malaysiensis TaxID=367825 RepID=A0ABM6F3I7_9BURK|nr:hypothetical protein [Cupriavidus malaysiensis]AOZ05971.1 hypothetical protein BKK80_09115 [Cupriavidus malaysiensis]